MQTADFQTAFAFLPLAELHLHLEGSIAPATLVELAARRGVSLSEADAAARYRYADFNGFLDAFKWATSLLKTPDDYGLITERMAESLRRQNVVYAEVTISAGVMRRRRQDVQANFAAIRAAGDCAAARGLRLQWIFDGTWQFGASAAVEIARLAASLRSDGVVAFGMGGDELSLPYAEFREAFELAAQEGLHCVAHAGEVGGPEKVREAVELLGAERIGHGIAAWRDPATTSLLAERRIPLELCPTSNLRTGALALQLSRPDATLGEFPLRTFVERDVPVTLSTDDPAMFATDLRTEYGVAQRCGLSPMEIVRVAEAGFEHAFLPPQERLAMLETFHAKQRALGLL